MRKFENLRDERKFDEGTKFQIFEGPKLNLLKLKIEKGGGGWGGEWEIKQTIYLMDQFFFFFET